jgi:uncharacterized protein (TIGR02118 family)
MATTIQVLYPITDKTSFDYDYYATSHMKLVNQHFGPHVQSAHVTRGLASGPDTPPDYYAIATLNFATHDAMTAALAGGDPVFADIANYYNGHPQMLIGETIS